MFIGKQSCNNLIMNDRNGLDCSNCNVSGQVTDMLLSLFLWRLRVMGLVLLKFANS